MRALVLLAIPAAAAIAFLYSRSASAAIAWPELTGEDLAGTPAPDFTFSFPTWSTAFDYSDPATPPADTASDSTPSAALELGGLGMLTGFGDAASTSANDMTKIFRLPAAAAPYAMQIDQAEQFYGLPQSLLGRVLYQESRFRPEIIDGTKRSSTGAIGIAQFMPATARELGVNPLDPYDSIDGAARYLRKLYDATGDWTAALAAYNWGIGNVTRKGIDAAPLETRNYIEQITRDVSV